MPVHRTNRQRTAASDRHGHRACRLLQSQTEPLLRLTRLERIRHQRSGEDRGTAANGLDFAVTDDQGWTRICSPSDSPWDCLFRKEVVGFVAPAGLSLSVHVAREPITKRATSFFDGQNLFWHAKAAFGYEHPNYDPSLLSVAVCRANGWRSHGVRFYTGVPTADRDPRWHGYWQRRLLSMRRAGIHVASRSLRYRTRTIRLPDGTRHEIDVKQEKGIDLRLGLDVIRLARQDQLDVAVIFSQDQDLAEVAAEIRDISRSQERWLKIVSAFPFGPGASATRGIDKTDWFRMDRAFYDACLDPRDYR